MKSWWCYMHNGPGGSVGESCICGREEAALAQASSTAADAQKPNKPESASDLAQMQASGAPSAVRMLTEDEIEAAWNEAARNYRARPVSTALSPADSESWHEAIAVQRAFAAANNLTVKDCEQ